VRVGAKDIEIFYTTIKSQTTSPVWNEQIGASTRQWVASIYTTESISVLGNLRSADEISIVRVELYSKNQITAGAAM
jgi:hypothetical protein